jgi:hypothetical protein
MIGSFFGMCEDEWECWDVFFWAFFGFFFSYGPPRL